MSAEYSANQRFYSLLIRERRKLSNEIFRIDSLKAAEMVDRLTGRERQVMEMKCYGLTIEQIARRLRITKNTAGGYVERIKAKTGIDTQEYGRIWFAYKMHEAMLIGMETTKRQKDALQIKEKYGPHEVFVEWEEVIKAARAYAYGHWRKTKRAKRLGFVELQGTLDAALYDWFERIVSKAGHVTRGDVWDQVERWVIARIAIGLDPCPIKNPFFNSAKGKIEEVIVVPMSSIKTEEQKRLENITSQRIKNGTHGTCVSCGAVVSVYVPKGCNELIRFIRRHSRVTAGRSEVCPGSRRASVETSRSRI